MRRSLHEVQEIDRYINKELNSGQRILFQAKMILSPGLRIMVADQQKVYMVITRFARNEQRKKLENIYNQLMQEPAFNKEITSIFS